MPKLYGRTGTEDSSVELKCICSRAY